MDGTKEGMAYQIVRARDSNIFVTSIFSSIKFSLTDSIHPKCINLKHSDRFFGVFG